MAETYGAENYGEGDYGRGEALGGYGSGLYGAGVYGGGVSPPTPGDGGNLFGRRSQPVRKTQPRNIIHEKDDEEVALIMAALL